jgi:hypothetical protein
MRRLIRSPALPTLFAVLAFSSCQQFFTTSLAKVLARDPADLVPAVTTGNAQELADSVKSDPDASLAVLDGLTSLIAETTDAEEQKTLVVLALEVSTNASGVSGAMLENAGSMATLLTNGDIEANKDDLFAIIDDTLAGLDNLSESSTSLLNIFTDTSLSVAAVAETASAEEMAMAAIVLLSDSASTSGGGVSAYVDQLGATPTANLTEKEQLAMDLAEAAAVKYAEEGGTGPLADILAALNLTGA